MRNLLLLAVLCLFGNITYAQLNCNNVNASMSLSVNGGTVTLTNNSTPTATSTIYTFYTVTWGDNATSYAYNNNNALTHTYNTSGTYTVTLYSQVLDSINNVNCYDTVSSSVTVTTSLNCNNVNASMYTYASGGNMGVLVNNSVPLAAPKVSVQYHIKWGDGNTTTTASKSNQTHLYTSNGKYNIELIVTVHDSNNNITCVDTAKDSLVITGAGQFNCNLVNVAFTKSVNGSNVTLTNNSTPSPGSGIGATYTIYWGDGNSSVRTNKNPVGHTYSSSGNYTIKMVATYTSSNITCIDSAQDTLNLVITPPNLISGLVVLDSGKVGPTDSVKIWLITFDPNTNLLTAVDSQMKHAYYPFYTFNNKAAGQYRTKAKLINGQTSGTGYVPTYHDSDLLWSNANVISHSGGITNNKNIYLKQGTVTAGPGFIGGNVLQGANKGTASGIPDMNILLLDANGDVIAFAVTDANGDYSFNNLPIGTYKVHPEDMNYNTTQASINISNGNTSYAAVNFVRSNSQKTIVPVAGNVAGIDQQAGFAVYPNPAKDIITINWTKQSDKTATIAITDISGKKMLDTQAPMNGNTGINVSALQSGIYFMNIHSEYGTSTQKLVIQ